jgi:hypothetical protein
MISDILAQAVDDLDHYLNDFDRTYTGELRHRISRFRNEADYLRSLLDVPPGVRLPPEAVLLERIDAQRSLRVEDRCYFLVSEAEDLGWPSPKSSKA